jgi:hypothetical protein
VLLLALAFWSATAADPCPDVQTAVSYAEAALQPLDVDTVAEQTVAAQRGLACGPIVNSPQLRARFWLVLAVMLNEAGDRSSVDDALSAAWRTYPDLSVAKLPARLQERYAELTEIPPEDASFRLLPLPDREAIIYIDGRATSAEALHVSLEADAAIRTKAGLHIIQLAEDVSATTAVAGGIRDLQSGEVEIFDIHKMSLFGRGSSSSISLPSRVRTSGPQGGCAGH